MTIREQREIWEAQTLSPMATLSAATKGRELALSPCLVRTAFVRDRDRILHCKSFRRLKHKTQVFLAPQGDHYRTRLTHTLEVSQIARTISRALLLNEDLTEAIAMGHDLGHTPFGHAGEDVLSELMPGGFTHNAQSLRVVEKLENEGQGLNLTWEVRDGIFHHKQSGTPATAEGRVVSLCDRIAYLNHDIDDAIRAGVLAESDLPPLCTEAFGHSHGARINAMIMSILDHTAAHGKIDFLPEHTAPFVALRDFMFERVYHNPDAKREEGKAKRAVRELYQYYKTHPNALPDDSFPTIQTEGIDRACTDFIAGMTDNYAIAEYERLFVPMSWR